jgi:hypothetical protein
VRTRSRVAAAHLAPDQTQGSPGETKASSERCSARRARTAQFGRWPSSRILHVGLVDLFSEASPSTREVDRVTRQPSTGPVCPSSLRVITQTAGGVDWSTTGWARGHQPGAAVKFGE